MLKSECTSKWILALQNDTCPFWSYGHHLAARISLDKTKALTSIAQDLEIKTPQFC
jgi:hypothetical protein